MADPVASPSSVGLTRSLWPRGPWAVESGWLSRWCTVSRQALDGGVVDPSRRWTDGLGAGRDLPGQDNGAEAVSRGRILGRVLVYSMVGWRWRRAVVGHGAFAAPPQPAQCLTCLASHGFGRDWRAQVAGRNSHSARCWSRPLQNLPRVCVCVCVAADRTAGPETATQQLSAGPKEDVNAVASMQSRAATCLFGGEVFLDCLVVGLRLRREWPRPWYRHSPKRARRAAREAGHGFLLQTGKMAALACCL